MDKIRIALDEALEQEFKDMYLQSPDEAGYAAATNRVAQLYKIKLEEDKNNKEIELKKAEAELKVVELAEVKKDRLVKIVLDGSAILVPLIFYGIWMKVGLRFEETGSFTSTTFRGLFSKFKPTR